MVCNFSYIKRGVNYIIGAVVLATNFGTAAFGGGLGESREILGQSSEEITGQVLNKDNDGYYLIGSSADLREFANLANKNEPKAKGKLTRDIEFNAGSVTVNGKLKEGHENFERWTPIGTKEKRFEGEFIGNNKKITGVYVDCEDDYQGLFGYIGKGGKIRDVKVDGSYIRGKFYVGGIAGCNYGKISDCVTNNVIEGKNNVGGNVGKNSERGIISGNCNNSGSVTGKNYVGGNVGYNIEGTITGNCNNEGVVKGEWAIGGNVGCNRAGIITGKCNNSGEVTGEKDNVGGNVGSNDWINDSGETIRGTIKGNCNNEGEVKGEKEVGGNVGHNDYGTIIGECKNIGSVTGKDKVGGNVGEDSGTISGKCKNIGTVKGKDEIGGNVGYHYGTMSGECENSGKIKGTSDIGGNIGENCHIVTGKCNNSGEVTGEDGIGGNIGWNQRTMSGKCENSGTVTGKRDVGGNVGKNAIFIFPKAIISGECKNSGEVRGEERVGGNVGWNKSSIVTDLLGQGDYNAVINEEGLVNKGTVNGKSANAAKKIGAQEWDRDKKCILF